jgi:predicted MFS family arabinose efflux permease
LLVGLAVTQGFDGAAFGVLAPEIRHAFGLDNAGIDAVTSLTAAVPVMCAIFLGYFGDRGNRLQLTAGGAVLWGVAAIFTGLAPVLGVLIAARLVGGVGLLASRTIYPSLLSDYYPPEGLAQIFTVYLIGSSGLGLVGSPLAGWLGSAVGWRPTFVVLALPTFLCVGLLAFLREPARRAMPAGAGPTGAGPAGSAAGSAATAAGEPSGAGAVPTFPGVPIAAHFEGSLRDGFRDVFAIRTLRRSWVAAFLFGGGTIPLATLVSDFFHDVYHVGTTDRGEIAALVGVCGLGGILAGGAITKRLMAQDRLVRLPLVSGLFVIEFGAFVFLMAVLPDVAGSIAAACVLAVGAVGYLPGYVTFVAVIAPADLRSQAYAWSLFFYALGAVAISAIIGAIADAQGQRVAMALLAGLVIVGGVIGISSRKFVPGDLARLEATT